MIVLIILGIFFSHIGGLSKAIRDTVSHHFEESIFSKLNPKFWNPLISGNNKWKNGDKNQGEKFTQSSNLLVGITESWHSSETINVFFLIAGVCLLTMSLGILGAVLARVMYGFTFTLAYKEFKI